MKQPGIYKERVWAELLRSTYEVSTSDGRNYLVVAWTLPGGAQTVRTTTRHLFDPSGRYLTTLCGRTFRITKLVTPNSYWTDRDCQRCRRIAGDEGKEGRP